MLPKVRQCRILHRSGALLQKIAARGWRDHRPLHCSFSHKLCYVEQHRQDEVRWDKDLLARGVLEGVRRRGLVGGVEAALANPKFETLSQGPPGPYWSALNTAVREVALGLYAREPAKTHKPADTDQAYRERSSMLHAVTSMPRKRFVQRDFHMCDLQHMLHSWQAVIRYWRARRSHQKLLQRDRRIRDNSKLLEFREAWASRQFSRMWRAARSLTGRALGPKRRRYDVPLASQPTVSEWTSHFEQGGPSGGCSATVIPAFDAFIDRGSEACRARSMAEAEGMAKVDDRFVRSGLRKHPMRKSVPYWSVPAEIRRQLLHPSESLQVARTGLGYVAQSLCTKLIDKRFYQGFVAIRRYDRAPEAWQISHTHKISKGNGKHGCYALRMVNCLDCVGKSFFKYVWKRGRPQSSRPYAYGYAKGRSRVEAMVFQHVVAERLRCAGRSFITCFHYIANAFPSMSHSHICSVVGNAAKTADCALLHQRVCQTAMVVHGSDGQLVLQPGSGTLQGDASADDVYLEGYHPLLDEWSDKPRELSPAFQITAFSPLDLSDQDMSLSTYADEICRRILVETPEMAAALVRHSNTVLDMVLAGAGMAQNTDKQEHVVVFKGSSSRKFTKQVLQGCMLDGKARPSAKYLGGIQRHDGTRGPEIDKRANAAYVSWATFRGLWHQRRLPWRGLRAVFLGMVYEVLFSGLEALVLGKMQYSRLDRIVATYGRKLLRGDACRKSVQEDGQTVYHSLSNADVFRRLGVPCAHTELRIRCLKLLQRWAKDPWKHHQVITAVFGIMWCDEGPTVDAESGLSCSANSYAKLFWEDLQSLAALDSACWLVDIAGNDVMSFFTVLAEDFVRIDVSELRARELSIAIPPPGYTPPQDSDTPAQDMEAPELVYECPIVLDTGVPCGQKFPCLRDLRLHQYKSGLSNHRVLSDYYKAAHINQCPWCFMVHASIVSTRKHVRQRILTGTCPAGSRYGSVVVTAPTPPQDTTCRFCNRECPDIPQLLEHIRSHFP